MKEKKTEITAHTQYVHGISPKVLPWVFSTFMYKTYIGGLLFDYEF